MFSIEKDLQRQLSSSMKQMNIGLTDFLKLKQNNMYCVLLVVQNVSVHIHMQ
jgi:hypothetical protein